jgi:adenine-specific DNA-methyltransferase
VDEATTRNLFIEGDNLEVLKLLQKSYAGRVKLIYIDPPYNTGNDFVYNDDFSEPLDEYLRRTGQLDDEGQSLTTNPRASGRFHSNWLNMMFPRLRLARGLLSETGVIFVSIDDNEINHLRLLMDEVFGSENFITQITVQSNPRGRQSERFVATVHEYVLVYARNVDTCHIAGASLTEEQQKEFKFQDQAGRKYRLLGLRQRGSASRREDRPNMYYPIYVNPNNGSVSLDKHGPFQVEVLPKKSTGEDGRWMWAAKKVRESMSRIEAKLIGTRNEWDIFVRDYLQSDNGDDRTRKMKTIWDEKEINYQNGTQEVKRLFGAGVVDFPKPVALLKKIITMGGDNEGVYLDFFAGSCTTAQAVLELNRADGGTRQFICVQLPERVEVAGYATIAEIGKDRIRRAIKSMRDEERKKLDLTNRESPEDLGFRVYKLGRSNYKAWQEYQGESVEELETLFDRIETPLVEGWKPELVLTEVLLLQGFPLDSTVTAEARFKHNRVQRVESDAVGHRLFICLDREIADATIEQIGFAPEDVFVCLDSALTDEAKLRLADRCTLRVI